jgi:HSP20 family protein
MAVVKSRDDWDLEREVGRLQREMGRLTRRSSRRTARSKSRIFPSIIISAVDDGLVVRAEVPGVSMEDLDVSVSGDTLTIQGTRITGEGLEGGWYHRRERESGGFSRAVRLPAEVDGANAEASYDSGVLTVSLPLREEVKPRQIPIRVVEG